jgi:hypothetical protein
MLCRQQGNLYYSHLSRRWILKINKKKLINAISYILNPKKDEIQ